MSTNIAALVATACVVVLYIVAAFGVRDRWGGTLPANPLKVTAHVTGRASLSRTQVAFFTLLFVWISVYWLMREGILISVDHTVLALLGITVVGAGLGRATDTARFRVSGENWAWAIGKRWISRDFSRASHHTTPKLSDLFTSDQGFEVARFQAVAFSLVVGIALLYVGATAGGVSELEKFSIGESYLTLIGISQGVYVGGKMVGGNPIRDLNRKLDEVRPLELSFSRAVAKSETWLRTDRENRTMALAREQIAPDEYSAYMTAATEAATLAQNLTGVPIKQAIIEPRLPDTT